MHNIIARTEIESRDCDGMHYNGATYEMEDTERSDQFGDLTFYDRILSYVWSPNAQDGTLHVSQDEDGFPILNWSERTDEGFHSCRATFHNVESE